MAGFGFGFGGYRERRRAERARRVALERAEARLRLVMKLQSAGVMPGRGADMAFVLGLLGDLIEKLEAGSSGAGADPYMEGALVALDDVETTLRYMLGLDLRD